MLIYIYILEILCLISNSLIRTRDSELRLVAEREQHISRICCTFVYLEQFARLSHLRASNPFIDVMSNIPMVEKYRVS